MNVSKDELNKTTEAIIGAAIAVHRELGPGLLESAYEKCLAYELIQRGFTIERQRRVPIIYKSIKIDCGYRLDMIVNDLVIFEIKAVDKLIPINEAQLLPYLKLTKMKVGLLINFHVPILKDGVKRIVNDFPD